MNLNQLMKENVKEPDYVEYQPSKRLVDEKGEPQTWLLRPLSTKESVSYTHLTLPTT